MEITKEVLDSYYLYGIECELLNPNKRFKFKKGDVVNLMFSVMRTGKIQIYSTLKHPAYQQSFSKDRITNFVKPVDPEFFDLINYLIA